MPRSWSTRRWVLWAVEVLIDMVLVSVSGYLAFWIRFESQITDYLHHYQRTILIVLAYRIFFFHWFGLYKGLWRYASIKDLLSIIKAVLASSVAVVATLYLKLHPGYPRSILIIDCLSDETVLPYHAEQLRQAVPSAESWSVDVCDHTMLYRDYPAEYEARLLPFFTQALD